MVRAMRAVGARTMLLTLSQNFSEWPPAVSSHRPHMWPEEKSAWRAAVRAGDALAASDCPAAIASWTKALAIDDEFADLQYRIARCELALGRLDAAARRVRPARDPERPPQG